MKRLFTPRLLNLLLGIIMSIIPVAGAHAASLSADDVHSIYNDSVWYKPGDDNSTGCQGVGSTLSGDSPGERVFNYFVGKGLSNDSAAAATGNLEVESSFVPDIWGGGGGNYYGLAQWGGGRYTNLLKFAGGSDNASKLNYQLDFVWYELNNGYQSTLQELHGSDSVTDKAIFWGRHYEVAVNPDGSLQSQDKRVADALKWSNTAAGAPAPAGDSAVSDNCLSTGSGDYANPFHGTDGLTAARIDEGVDYISNKPVPIYAIGNGVVTIATDHSTFYTTSGGHADWITYKLTDGPAAGKFVYVSEACPPLVKTGDTVTVNTRLCNVLPDSIETGWALDATSQAAAAYGAYQEGYETAYGVNFNQLLVKLGAPGGHLDTSSDPGGVVLGSLPSGWPSWQ